MPTNSAGRNFKRTRESSLFGTRKLAFYALTCSPDYNLVGDITQGYSFRVNTETGLVTFDADITSKSIGEMLDNEIDEADDDYFSLTLPFDIEFLGGGLTNTIYINSNSGISFYNGSSARPDPESPDTGEPNIFIANNDGDIQFLYTDDSVTGEYRVKFRGNTDFDNSEVVNLTWEALFREGETYIDFFVSEQPTDWAAYDDGQGNVTWGVTDGTNWVDGRTVEQRGESFVPFVAAAEELWRLPNSTYYKVVQAIQQSGAEIFWLGTPHNRTESFQVDWSGLTINDDGDGFVFAIADDADAPTAFLDSTTSGPVAGTSNVGTNYIELDNIPNNVYIGQRVVFSGTTVGGLVAGQDYYVKTKGLYDTDSKLWITVSDTVEREVLDIVYPEGVGGEPGPEVSLTAATGEFDATFYNYNIEWGGTAGDVLSSCCYNLTQPGVSPMRLQAFITDSGALDGPGYWWLERCNPSYSIFPAWQLQTP
jgi:hypothetical protein